MEAFKNSSEAWRSRVQTAAALQTEFAELLREEPAQAAAVAERKGAAEADEGVQAGDVLPRKKRRKRAAEGLAAAPPGRPAADGEQQPTAERKKRRKDAGSVAAAGVAQQPTLQAPAAVMKKRKKALRALEVGEVQASSRKVRKPEQGAAVDVLGLLLTGTADLEPPALVRRKTKKRASAG